MSGAWTGMLSMKKAYKKIQPDLHLAPLALFGAVSGTAMPGSAGPLVATVGVRRPATISLVVAS